MRLFRKRYAFPERDGSLSFGDDKVRITITPEFRTEITELIGEWRKANAIHGWFVDNVQEGKDDQAEYKVSREQLEKLRSTVKEVLDKIMLKSGKVSQGYTFSDTGEKVHDYADGQVIANPEVAQKLLPTREGFFFGYTEYDEWYVDDLKHTKLILDTALKSSGDATFTYQADW
jgi:hypothetical protein